MSLLLTGASGFLGHHVLEALASRRPRLLVLPEDPALLELRQRAELEIVLGDLTRPETLPHALEGVQQVVHLAGSVNGGRGPPEAFLAVNATGTENLARAAREAGVSHFLYTSSVTVYGHVQDALESAPLAPAEGYPESKALAEAVLRELLPEQATILRLPLVLGAGDTGFFEPALEGLRRTGRVILIGSGRAPWSVLSARDVARAIALCLDSPATRGGLFNVAGDTVTNGELLRAIGEAAGCTRELRLPTPVAWVIAALGELSRRGALTRSQVRALSQPLSLDGSAFARLGFTARTGWRQALAEAVASSRLGASTPSPAASASNASDASRES